MEKLKPPELSRLRNFVEEVLTVCENDDAGITFDLYESALVAAEILGMTVEEKEQESEQDPTLGPRDH